MKVERSTQRSHKYIGCLFLVIAILMLAGCGSGKAAERVVERMFTALEEGDHDAYLDTLLPSNRNRPDLEGILAALLGGVGRSGEDAILVQAELGEDHHRSAGSLHGGAWRVLREAIARDERRHREHADGSDGGRDDQIPWQGTSAGAWSHLRWARASGVPACDAHPRRRHRSRRTPQPFVQREVTLIGTVEDARLRSRHIQNHDRQRGSGSQRTGVGASTVSDTFRDTSACAVILES